LTILVVLGHSTRLRVLSAIGSDISVGINWVISDELRMDEIAAFELECKLPAAREKDSIHW